MKRWLILTALLVVIAVLSFFLLRRVPIYQAANSSQATVTIDNKIYSVIVARTPAEQIKGLSGQVRLAANAGMLFPFNPPQQPTFWMIEMNFPLDMVWISNNKIIHITYDAPAPAKGTPEGQLPLYSAGASIDNVLEINAGQAQNFKIGDSVKIVTAKSS